MFYLWGFQLIGFSFKNILFLPFFLCFEVCLLLIYSREVLSCSYFGALCYVLRIFISRPSARMWWKYQCV